MEEMSGARPGASPMGAVAAVGVAPAGARRKFWPTMKAKRQSSAMPATLHGRMLLLALVPLAARGLDGADPSVGAPQRWQNFAVALNGAPQLTQNREAVIVREN